MKLEKYYEEGHILGVVEIVYKKSERFESI